MTVSPGRAPVTARYRPSPERSPARRGRGRCSSGSNGMWMGGLAPLGYYTSERRLVINPAEAETVRSIFALYREREIFSTGSLRIENTTTRSGQTCRCKRMRRFGVRSAKQAASCPYQSWADSIISTFEFEFATRTSPRRRRGEPPRRATAPVRCFRCAPPRS
jgi:hypothetical protein